MPTPITSTVIELLKLLMTEEQAKFIHVFKKPSLNIEELKQKSKLNEAALNKMLKDLMHQGIIVGVPSRRTGVMVYRLLPMWPGIFEYQFLRGKATEIDKKKARLFEKLFKEMRQTTQENYDNIVKHFKDFPALDRTIPVEKFVNPGVEGVLPHEEVKKLLEDYEDIAVAHCYCRTEKELIGEKCKLNAPKENCFFFDKSAKFVIEHEFGKRISKAEAIKVFKEAEDYGLVHKVFHVHLDPNRGIEAICNCCSCCCGSFQMYHQGAFPLHTISSYLARINEDICVACGTCVEMCPMKIIEINDAVAKLDENKCIGCGVCAYHCPNEAIQLIRTGPRDVFVLPPKISKQ
ncbi:MAG: 4Fe-4S binding protein [Promethearchaeota archaeon]